MRAHESLRQIASCSRALPRCPLQQHVLPTARDGRQSRRQFTSPSSPASSSSSAASSSRSTLSHVEGVPSHHDYRKLLQSCSRIFDKDTPLQSTVWRSRLREANDSLGLGAGRPTRIAVVGASESGTSDLLTCLLDEPLSNASGQTESVYKNEDIVKALELRNSTRNKLHHKPLKIRYGPRLGSNDALDDFTIPHAWLKNNNIELIEIIDPTMTSETLDELYRSDLVLFVTDDLTLAAHKRYHNSLQVDTTLQLVRYFAHKPATRVLVNHAKPPTILEDDLFSNGLKTAIGGDAFSSLQKQLSTSSNAESSSILVHTSLGLASQANDSLRLAITAPRKETKAVEGEEIAAWQDFTSLYTASGMINIKSTMERLPLSPVFAIEGQGEPEVKGAAIQTVNYLIRQALDQALYGITAELEEVRQAQGAATVLREEVQASKVKTLREIFSLRRQDDTSQVHEHERAGDRSKLTEAATRDSKGFVEKAFASRLPWWRILWKVDDVRAETEAAVGRSFSRDVEDQLIFETGKLLHIVERLQHRTTTVFQLLNPSSHSSYRPLDSLERDHGTFQSAFDSPILLNQLRQHSTEHVEKSLRPDLLTSPIERRRRQLLAVGGPVDALSTKAQKSVLTTIAFVGSSGALSIVGALAGGPFGIGLPAFCAPLAMQASTATGFFALATLSSIWLLQTRWTRAKKRFWRQWERIADGLDDDLLSNMDDVFENIVGAQNMKGAAGLETLAKKRVEQLEKLYSTVEEVTSEIKRVTLTKTQASP